MRTFVRKMGDAGEVTGIGTIEYNFDNYVGPLQGDLAAFVRQSMGDMERWSSVRRLFNILDVVELQNKWKDGLMIAPGQAMYFIGGRLSLIQDLYSIPLSNIKATTSSLAVGCKTKITLGSRVLNFLKNVGQPKHGRIVGGRDVNNWFSLHETEYNEMLTKSITCLCVYNTDTRTIRPPANGRNTHSDEMTLPEISSLFRQIVTGD